MAFWVLRIFLLNPGHLYSTVLGGDVASASCWACQQYPGQSRALNHWACGWWWGGSSAPGLARWHPSRGKWGSASLSLSEGMKSDSPKPHCQQGGRSRGLNALLLGWGREVHLNSGPCWHCPGALPSSALKGMEGRSAPCSALLTLPHRGTDVHCLIPSGRVGDPLSAWPSRNSRSVGVLGLVFPWCLARGKRLFLQVLVGASWWFWVGDFCGTPSKIYGSQ